MYRINYKKYLAMVPMILFTICAIAQRGTLKGLVTDGNNPLELATIVLSKTSFGAISDEKGQFEIPDIPYGEYEVLVSYVGYREINKKVVLNPENQDPYIEIHFTLNTSIIDDVVVTGTKTFKRQTNSPLIVNVLSSKTLDNVQACNLSDGLRFQPGLRVENDCQTCNYTQLRMNGLAGAYSQILINGRPIFSPLTGLYGMEQLPVNMIERIEVVRGGGSSLYGSSAIGGTVNVITKIPKSNDYELAYTFQNINEKSNDHIISGNATLVSKNKKSGLSFFMNHRERDFYDHNGDNFSEIPLLENTSIGTNLFFLPKENQKIEISLSNLNEYRFGGEMVDKPAYLTLQSEERTHNVWMGSADYQINFNHEKSTLITYLAWQNTKRKHYTGIFPDEPSAIQKHYELPPYGTSDALTFQGGFQFNHELDEFIAGKNILTIGSEYIIDAVYDNIEAYQYLVDQRTNNFGLFLQSDWELFSGLSLLSGIRMDWHNLVDNLVFNPRVSLLYKYKANTQFRLNYGTGFRAPQAFDTDLHIAFAGGGVSRVTLSPDLRPEKSQSWSASVNYDKPTEHFITGFTLEGFYTRLNEAFFLQPIGQDNFGEQFEKRNGPGAAVKGITAEFRINYDRKLQLESGFTFQSSRFDEAISYIDEVPGMRSFIRTPNDYGFATLSFTPNKKLNANINYVYTGTMEIPHFAGSPEQDIDEIITSQSFSEISLKLAYTTPLGKMQSNIEWFGGIKNILNSYQSDFDTGKNRDSNFVYGPALPRTFFIGFKIKSK